MYAGSVIESFAPVFQFLTIGGQCRTACRTFSTNKAVSRRNAGLFRVDTQQINQRENKHPDEIDEVPVKAAHFDVVGGPLALAVSRANNCEISDADCDVQHVQPGEAEECPAE